MPIQLPEENEGQVLVVHVSGKLEKAHYEAFVPEFERLAAEHGKLRVLFDMTGFQGRDAGALWEDTKFAFHNFHSIEPSCFSRRDEVATWNGGLLQAAMIKYYDYAEATGARK